MENFGKKHWRGGGLKFSVTPLPCTILNGTALKNPVSFSFKSYLLFTSTLQYDLIVHNDEKSLQNILKCVEVCLHVKHMASINYRPMINHFCALNNVFSSSPHRKKVWKFILKKCLCFIYLRLQETRIVQKFFKMLIFMNTNTNTNACRLSICSHVLANDTLVEKSN